MVIDGGPTYTPYSTEIIPDIAQIGDFGSLPDLIGSDGTEIVSYWELINGNASLANYVTYQTKYDAFGSIEYFGDMIIAIDESGDPKSIEFKFTYANGVTVTLYGERTI